VTAFALRSSARRPGTRFLRRSFVLTRSIRAALDGRGEPLEQLEPVLVLYLLQLAAEKERPATCGFFRILRA